MFLTNTGRAYRIRGHRDSGGQQDRERGPLLYIPQLMPDEKITAMIPIQEYEDGVSFVYGNREGACEKDSDYRLCKC